MKTKEHLNAAKSGVVPQPDKVLGRGFFEIVVGSTALGLACLAAALEALRQGAEGFTFRISGGTFVAFGVGLAAALLLWKMAARSLFALRLSAVLLILTGLGGFLYPLRFVPSDKIREIGVGLGVAVCAISTGAIMLWQLKRFFDADYAATESKRIE